MKGTITHPLVGNKKSASLLREGWSLLVDRLGIQKATQFVILLERGKGDTVEEIIRYWGEKDIDDIHADVMSLKADNTHQEISA